MKHNSVIKNNILLFLDYKKITKYEFYKITGISNGILSQRNGLSEENILRILTHFPELSEKFLLTGQGSMLKNQELYPPTPPHTEDNTHKASETIDKGTFDMLLDRIQNQSEEIGRLKFSVEDFKKKIEVLNNTNVNS
jgi:hypothetical protein